MFSYSDESFNDFCSDCSFAFEDKLTMPLYIKNSSKHCINSYVSFELKTSSFDSSNGTASNSKDSQKLKMQINRMGIKIEYNNNI